jgi:hypothetical protein
MPVPIRNNGVPATVTPARTDTPAPAAPTTPAATVQPGGWTPGTAAPVAPRGDAFGVIASRVTERLGPMLTAKSNFELVPGRYPNAVGLPQVLAGISSSPQGQAAVKALLGQLEAKTGIAVPTEVQAAALAHPEQATRAFELTTKQLAAGMDGINTAYHAGKIKQVEPRKFALPQKFDLANLDAAQWTRPTPEMKELAPGLFSGDLPSTTPDAELKRNTLMAEVFQRLSSNPGASEKFEVSYGGKQFTGLNDLLGALKADGYEVNVSFEQRIANFANLKTPVPGSNPPQFLDVPTPLMIKTGMVDSTGKEAVVPSAHSEMVVSLRSGPNTRGPKLDSDQKFYQGVSGTGFFPVGSFASPAWCGKSTLAELHGDKALDAVKLAGVFTDVVQQSAKKLDLYADGYGITGVCNDSVAVIEQATTGKAHEYPLLMKDSSLTPELERRLTDGDRSDDALCKKLKQAIRDLPSDVRQNASSRERAQASIPWTKGAEPFQSTVDARKILGG